MWFEGDFTLVVMVNQLFMCAYNCFFISDLPIITKAKYRVHSSVKDKNLFSVLYISSRIREMLICIRKVIILLKNLVEGDLHLL